MVGSAVPRLSVRTDRQPNDARSNTRDITRAESLKESPSSSEESVPALQAPYRMPFPKMLKLKATKLSSDSDSEQDRRSPVAYQPNIRFPSVGRGSMGGHQREARRSWGAQETNNVPPRPLQPQRRATEELTPGSWRMACQRMTAAAPLALDLQRPHAKRPQPPCTPIWALDMKIISDMGAEMTPNIDDVLSLESGMSGSESASPLAPSSRRGAHTGRLSPHSSPPAHACCGTGGSHWAARPSHVAGSKQGKAHCNPQVLLKASPPKRPVPQFQLALDASPQRHGPHSHEEPETPRMSLLPATQVAQADASPSADTAACALPARPSSLSGALGHVSACDTAPAFRTQQADMAAKATNNLPAALQWAASSPYPTSTSSVSSKQAELTTRLALNPETPVSALQHGALASSPMAAADNFWTPASICQNDTAEAPAALGARAEFASWQDVVPAGGLLSPPCGAQFGAPLSPSAASPTPAPSGVGAQAATTSGQSLQPSANRRRYQGTARRATDGGEQTPITGASRLPATTGLQQLPTTAWLAFSTPSSDPQRRWTTMDYITMRSPVPDKRERVEIFNTWLPRGASPRPSSRGSCQVASPPASTAPGILRPCSSPAPITASAPNSQRGTAPPPQPAGTAPPSGPHTIEPACNNVSEPSLLMPPLHYFGDASIPSSQTSDSRPPLLTGKGGVLADELGMLEVVPLSLQDSEHVLPGNELLLPSSDALVMALATAANTKYHESNNSVNDLEAPETAAQSSFSSLDQMASAVHASPTQPQPLQEVRSCAVLCAAGPVAPSISDLLIELPVQPQQVPPPSKAALCGSPLGSLPPPLPSPGCSPIVWPTNLAMRFAAVDPNTAAVGPGAATLCSLSLLGGATAAPALHAPSSGGLPNHSDKVTPAVGVMLPLTPGTAASWFPSPIPFPKLGDDAGQHHLQPATPCIFTCFEELATPMEVDTHSSDNWPVLHGVGIDQAYKEERLQPLVEHDSPTFATHLHPLQQQTPACDQLLQAPDPALPTVSSSPGVASIASLQHSIWKVAVSSNNSPEQSNHTPAPSLTSQMSSPTLNICRSVAMTRPLPALPQAGSGDPSSTEHHLDWSAATMPWMASTDCTVSPASVRPRQCAAVNGTAGSMAAQVKAVLISGSGTNSCDIYQGLAGEVMPHTSARSGHSSEGELTSPGSAAYPSPHTAQQPSIWRNEVAVATPQLFSNPTFKSRTSRSMMAAPSPMRGKVQQPLPASTLCLSQGSLPRGHTLASARPMGQVPSHLAARGCRADTRASPTSGSSSVMGSPAAHVPTTPVSDMWSAMHTHPPLEVQDCWHPALPPDRLGSPSSEAGSCSDTPMLASPCTAAAASPLPLLLHQSTRVSRVGSSMTSSLGSRSVLTGDAVPHNRHLTTGAAALEYQNCSHWWQSPCPSDQVEQAWASRHTPTGDSGSLKRRLLSTDIQAKGMPSVGNPPITSFVRHSTHNQAGNSSMLPFNTVPAACSSVVRRHQTRGRSRALHCSRPLHMSQNLLATMEDVTDAALRTLDLRLEGVGAKPPRQRLRASRSRRRSAGVDMASTSTATSLLCHTTGLVEQLASNCTSPAHSHSTASSADDVHEVTQHVHDSISGDACYFICQLQEAQLSSSSSCAVTPDRQGDGDGSAGNPGEVVDALAPVWDLPSPQASITAEHELAPAVLSLAEDAAPVEKIGQESPLASTSVLLPVPKGGRLSDGIQAADGNSSSELAPRHSTCSQHSSLSRLQALEHTPPGAAAVQRLCFSDLGVPGLASTPGNDAQGIKVQQPATARRHWSLGRDFAAAMQGSAAGFSSGIVAVWADSTGPYSSMGSAVPNLLAAPVPATPSAPDPSKTALPQLAVPPGVVTSTSSKASHGASLPLTPSADASTVIASSSKLSLPYPLPELAATKPLSPSTTLPSTVKGAAEAPNNVIGCTSHLHTLPMPTAYSCGGAMSRQHPLPLSATLNSKPTFGTSQLPELLESASVVSSDSSQQHKADDSGHVTSSVLPPSIPEVCSYLDMPAVTTAVCSGDVSVHCLRSGVMPSPKTGISPGPAGMVQASNAEMAAVSQEATKLGSSFNSSHVSTDGLVAAPTTAATVMASPSHTLGKAVDAGSRWSSHSPMSSEGREQDETADVTQETMAPPHIVTRPEAGAAAAPGSLEVATTPHPVSPAVTCPAAAADGSAVCTAASATASTSSTSDSTVVLAQAVARLIKTAATTATVESAASVPSTPPRGFASVFTQSSQQSVLRHSPSRSQQRQQRHVSPLPLAFCRSIDSDLDHCVDQGVLGSPIAKGPTRSGNMLEATSAQLGCFLPTSASELPTGSSEDRGVTLEGLPAPVGCSVADQPEAAALAVSSIVAGASSCLEETESMKILRCPASVCEQRAAAAAPSTPQDKKASTANCTKATGTAVPCLASPAQPGIRAPASCTMRAIKLLAWVASVLGMLMLMTCQKRLLDLTGRTGLDLAACPSQPWPIMTSQCPSVHLEGMRHLEQQQHRQAQAAATAGADLDAAHVAISGARMPMPVRKEVATPSPAAHAVSSFSHSNAAELYRAKVRPEHAGTSTDPAAAPKPGVPAGTASRHGSALLDKPATSPLPPAPVPVPPDGGETPRVLAGAAGPMEEPASQRVPPSPVTWMSPVPRSTNSMRTVSAPRLDVRQSPHLHFLEAPTPAPELADKLAAVPASRDDMASPEQANGSASAVLAKPVADPVLATHPAARSSTPLHTAQLTATSPGVLAPAITTSTMFASVGLSAIAACLVLYAQSGRNLGTIWARVSLLTSMAEVGGIVFAAVADAAHGAAIVLLAGWFGLREIVRTASSIGLVGVVVSMAAAGHAAAFIWEAAKDVWLLVCLNANAEALSIITRQVAGQVASALAAAPSVAAATLSPMAAWARTTENAEQQHVQVDFSDSEEPAPRVTATPCRAYTSGTDITTTTTKRRSKGSRCRSALRESYLRRVNTSEALAPPTGGRYILLRNRLVLVRDDDDDAMQ